MASHATSCDKLGSVHSMGVTVLADKEWMRSRLQGAFPMTHDGWVCVKLMLEVQLVGMEGPSWLHAAAADSMM